MPRLVFWPQAARVASTARQDPRPDAERRAPPACGAAASALSDEVGHRHAMPGGMDDGRCPASAPPAPRGRPPETARRRCIGVRPVTTPVDGAGRTPRENVARQIAGDVDLGHALQPLPGRHAVDLKDLQVAVRALDQVDAGMVGARPPPRRPPRARRAGPSAAGRLGVPPWPTLVIQPAPRRVIAATARPPDHEHPEIPPAARPAGRRSAAGNRRRRHSSGGGSSSRAVEQAQAAPLRAEQRLEHQRAARGRCLAAPAPAPLRASRPPRSAASAARPGASRKLVIDLSTQRSIARASLTTARPAPPARAGRRAAASPARSCPPGSERTSTIARQPRPGQPSRTLTALPSELHGRKVRPAPR